jgi:hypothetical protein
MDQNDKSYPAGYDHVGKKVEEAQQRLGQLDQQISQVPKNSKPAPILKPPGFVQPKQFNHDSQVNALKEQQAQIKDETLRDVEGSLKDADPKTARQVRDRTREAFYPNPFKKMTIAEKNRQHSQWKDVDRSQDYMDSMFKTARPNPEKEADKPKENDMPSISMRFSQGLGYTKARAKTGKFPDRGKDKDIDRE